MGFAPFQPLKTFGQTWLPNASNTAPAVATPPPAVPVPVPAPEGMVPPTSILPVTPTTPVLPSGPTAPLPGTATTPQAEIGGATLKSAGEHGLAAVIVFVLTKLFHMPTGEALTFSATIATILTTLLHLFIHKKAGNI